MKSTPQHLGPLEAITVRRRSFLRMIVAGAAVAGVPTLLTGCTTAQSAGPAVSAGPIGDVIPTFVPIDYAKPDFPSVKGSTPGFTTLPDTLVQSIPKAPGSGTSFKAMTPLWGTIPPTKGNEYYGAVNAALGSTIEFQITDGNTYGDKLATVLASSKDVPDWVCIPSWVLPPRFGTEIVENVFEDLTPFLAGDKAKAYPNLANIPSDAWKICVFNGKLYGLPMPGAGLSDATFYRKDVLDGLGITPDIRNGEDLLALAVELTDASAGRWGTEDLWNTARMMHGVVSEWKLEDSGKLLNRVETDEYRLALEWTAKLFASGAVHPDAVADQQGDAKKRFQSGKSLIMSDGVGGWHEALRDNLGTNPTYWQQPLEPFAADGGTPVYYKGAPANIYSFLKKSDDKARITELLTLANVLAAPFGTTEFDLVANGVEGVHFTRDSAGLPVPTELAASELQPTYVFLVAGPMADARVQYPGYVEAASKWQTAACAFAIDPVFYGRQISAPQQFASIGGPFIDLEKDINRGRKSVSDLDGAIATWKASGGEELRAFYQKILDAQ